MREVLSLNAKWAFTKNATEIPTEINNKWDFINLPHCWNAIDGQDGGNDYYRGTCYYAKELDKMELPKADHYYLEIKGANSSADVYVNGKKAGEHLFLSSDAWKTPFAIDITNFINWKKPHQTVVVRVEDKAGAGGIWKAVHLVAK